MRRPILFAIVLMLVPSMTAAAPLAKATREPGRTVPSASAAPDRQGGDTIFDAQVIPSLPFWDSGTTAGYTDVYDEVCPYTGSISPDVVYSFTSATTIYPVMIDLCGSSYDTKVYVYDESLTLVACNDDYYTGDPCGQYVSLLEDVEFVAGTTYYIVIDGWGGDFGDYQIDVHGYMIPCYEEYPDNEGEPPLVDGYVDTYNGGCDSAAPRPFQPIAGDAAGEAFLSGRSGWYEAGGETRVDTDWFLLTVGATGAIVIETCAYQNSYLEEVGPQDCDAWTVLQSELSIYWVESQMTIAGHEPGATVWLRFRPTLAEPPGWAEDVYGYNLWIHGLAAPVATESRTWSSIKASYR